MTGVVVDASALAAVVFDEPEALDVRRRLHGYTLHATTLIDYELTNTALKKMRREPERTAAVLAALYTGRRLRLRRVRPDMTQVLTLAALANLTAYDASYLWLAKTLGVKLVTLDQALARAAERM